MRTTLNLADELVTRAKHLAIEQHTTLTAIIEEALRERLEREEGDEEFDLPTIGGTLPKGFPEHGSLGKMLAFLESLDDRA